MTFTGQGLTAKRKVQPLQRLRRIAGVFLACIVLTLYNFLTMDGPYIITIRLPQLVPWANISKCAPRMLIRQTVNTTAFTDLMAVDEELPGFPKEIDAIMYNDTRLLKPPPEILSVLDAIDSTWKFRPDAAEELRSALEANLSTINMYIVTQNNTSKDTPLTLAAEKGQYKLSEVVAGRQPAGPPFSYKQFKTCNIVGSSGLLKGSKCGSQINSAEFIIRFNMPPMSDSFKEDIGIRTHFVTCNGATIHNEFQDIRSMQWLRVFRNHVVRNKYGKSLIFTMPFNVQWHVRRLIWFQTAVPKARVPNRVVFNHPHHKIAAEKFWNDRGLDEKSFSSGFYMITSALAFCEKITVYGFWPFKLDRDGSPLSYHYSETSDTGPKDGGVNNTWHRMDREFVKLVELYKQGIIRLVTSPCVQHSNTSAV